jgi:hypothetical protein
VLIFLNDCRNIEYSPILPKDKTARQMTSNRESRAAKRATQTGKQQEKVEKQRKGQLKKAEFKQQQQNVEERQRREDKEGQLLLI